MESVTFKAWVARDNIDDKYYPRTFLYAKKPHKEEIYCYGKDYTCEWDDSYGKLGSYDIRDLFPDLKFEDGPIEVEVTIKPVK
jgi:hypothetical protein